ncbi:MAG: Bug family tripartite tricarboxylate transporter substrate binding protein [Burkholderiales bacterium]
MEDSKRLKAIMQAAAMLVAGVLALPVQADWRPDRPVEIVVPTGAGGTNDQMARLVQSTLQAQKLISVPALVVNKSGGNQSLAVVYVNQHKADPHYLLYSTATVFTNEIAGLTKQKYTELPPVALLLVDYTVISVKADSPIKNMRDMVAKLKANPEAISFGLVSRGGPNHLAAAQTMTSAGIQPKALKFVVFKTNAQSMTAAMGGHIDAVVSSVSAAMPQTEAGNMRILGIAAPQRQSGKLAQVPTMREEGMPATGIPNWRGILAAPGVGAEQVAFWSGALTKVVAAKEWKQQLEENNVASEFTTGEALHKWLAQAYQDTRTVMSDLGLVK